MRNSVKIKIPEKKALNQPLATLFIMIHDFYDTGCRRLNLTAIPVKVLNEEAQVIRRLFEYSTYAVCVRSHTGTIFLGVNLNPDALYVYIC